MKERTDCELLGDYAENGSETAFTELIGRHLGLVYSAALRVVIDPHLAEDVTQTTFTILAREARRLRGRAFLSSWLHRTAANQAANLVRGEMRRRAREQEAFAMQTSESEPEWKQLAPVLDAALNSMAERDRVVIFLRFFEKKTAADIARALSLTEEAAQKRIARALGRLRASLCGHGVSLSATTLAALVAAQAVAATPIGLLASASTAALAGGAVGGQIVGTTLKLLIMSKLKIGALSALVAAAVVVPVLIHQNQIAHLRENNDALRHQLGEMRSDNEKSSARPAPATQRPEMADAERSELLRLRGEVSRLRRDAQQSARLPAKPQAERPATPPTEEEVRKFDEQRTRTLAAVKQLGLQLRLARRNAKAATVADGSLDPSLIARTHPDFDLKQVEMLVSEPELTKIMAEAPTTIIARTDPVRAPDGNGCGSIRWRTEASMRGQLTVRMRLSPEIGNSARQSHDSKRGAAELEHEPDPREKHLPGACRAAAVASAGLPVSAARQNSAGQAGFSMGRKVLKKSAVSDTKITSH